MGDFSQRESHSYRRQNNRRHIERPNKHHGQVRGGSYGGMEEPFPSYRGECSSGVLTNGGRSLDHHAKPILALPLGQAKISTPGKHSALAKREVILDAPLWKITEWFGKDSSRTSDITEENTSGAAYRDDGYGKPFSAQTPPVLNADHSMYTEYSKQPSTIRDSEACCEPISKGDQGEERVETSMDFEGDKGGAATNVLWFSFSLQSNHEYFNLELQRGNEAHIQEDRDGLGWMAPTSDFCDYRD